MALLETLRQTYLGQAMLSRPNVKGKVQKEESLS